MINLHNVSKVFSHLTLDKLSFKSSASISIEEEHVALNLYKCLEFILESTCTSHAFEIETTLDHDDEIAGQDIEISYHSHPYTTVLIQSRILIMNLLRNITLRNHFALDCMKRVVDCYDEINPVTGKRKRECRTIKHFFQRVPIWQCISRFRKYIEAGGTKQKLDDVDTYASDQVKRSRH